MSRQLRSDELRCINENLRKCDFYWSFARGEVAELTPTAVADDQRQSLRSVLMLGLLGFGSLFGLILLILIVLSMRYLVKNRNETAIFNSLLARDTNLQAPQIDKLLEEIKLKPHRA